jgi:hypothetical protein
VRQHDATLRAKEAPAAEEQKCREWQAQRDARPPPTDREGQREVLKEEKQALATEKLVLQERHAALRAAMQEFDANVAAREAAMEGRDGGRRWGCS